MVPVSTNDLEEKQQMFDDRYEGQFPISCVVVTGVSIRHGHTLVDINDFHLVSR